MLVIRKRADPVGRRRRQLLDLHVVVEHRDRLRKGRAPSVAHKPPGRLRLRSGDELHKAALERLRERFDEIRADGIHLQILPGQPLPVQWTFIVRLDDLNLRHYVLDEGPQIGQLCRGDGAQRGILDRRAAEQVLLQHRHETSPRLVARMLRLVTGSLRADLWRFYVGTLHKRHEVAVASSICCHCSCISNPATTKCK